MKSPRLLQSFSKNFLIVVLVLLTISALFALFAEPFQETEEITITQLAENIQQGTVQRILVSGNDLSVTYTDGREAQAVKESELGLSQTLLNYGVQQDQLRGVEVLQEKPSGFSQWIGPLSFLLFPLLLFIFFFWMIFRQAKGGINQAFDFTRARARLFGGEGQKKVTFGDVAGLKEAKEEVQEVVDFLKNPEKYLKMGAKIPRGVLLVGAPGTGKTLLARAVANEAGVAFFSASGSEFIEMFVGVGSSRVRDLFQTAKKAGRSIIFIDELDAIGRIRGSSHISGGGHDEREQTLNQILTEMDGFERTDTQIVMAATNRPDVLDPALLRPGRFDRRIILDLPDVNDREQILTIHGRGKPLGPDVSIREIAERTPGFSGADLESLMNEAAILAARRNKTRVEQSELLESIDKVLLGPERKSHILSQDEKRVTAFHEAGHALVSASLKHTDPVRKVSIISRGRAGGYTLNLPTEEKHLKTRSEFVDEMAVLLGGYAAEHLVFHEVTTGASNDLEKASEIARRLVKEFGMSEKLGPVTYGERDGSPFLGGGFGETKNYSDAVAATIDKEVATLLENARKTAEKVIRQKRITLEKIAQVLIQKETIEREEFEKLVGTKKQGKRAVGKKAPAPV
ncbi:MAG: ATP-dependent zinc metalloprotease FtsH [Candidatus Yanofskybacteria bacterium]|nr:ATP-dependent zinc metalloprotease FtsH [Candidatus Yanofskybacteria bacterium]